jgi:hypothetical protein
MRVGVDVTAMPAEIASSLGAYGPCLFDGSCGEIIAWGHRIVRPLGSPLWEELTKYGERHCAGLSGAWCLVIDRLTREEAEAQHGPVSAEEFGPRGGWRSVTFGNKRFISTQFKRKAS